METQKAVLLIVGVLVAGLVLGSVFSGKSSVTGEVKYISDPISSSGCAAGRVEASVVCCGTSYTFCVGAGSEMWCDRNCVGRCDDGGFVECPKPKK